MKLGSVEKDAQEWQFSRIHTTEFYKKDLPNGSYLEIMIDNPGNLQLIAHGEYSEAVFVLDYFDNRHPDEAKSYLSSYDVYQEERTYCDDEGKHRNLLIPFLAEEFNGIPVDTMTLIKRAIEPLTFRISY